MTTNKLTQLTLTPLSAGDIIDRAVRLYRLHLVAVLRIVLPPSLLAYAGTILWTFGVRNLSFSHGDRRMVLMISSFVLGGLMWLVGKAAFLMVLGAASRSLVWHFFDGTPIKPREVYRAVRERIWGLLGATILLTLLILGLTVLGYFIFAITAGLYILLTAWALQGLPTWLQTVIHFIFGGTFLGAMLCVALLCYARIILLPQAMMVEGKSVFDAFGRAFRLAGREIKRPLLILLFQIYLAWSLYAILLVPLGWYAWLHQVAFNPLGDSNSMWLSIAQQTLTQLGEILIAPIVLISFTLFYIDIRIRQEGFDIELLANRVLPQARTGDKAEAARATTTQRRAVDWSVTSPGAQTSSPLDYAVQTQLFAPAVAEPSIHIAQNEQRERPSRPFPKPYATTIETVTLTQAAPAQPEAVAPLSVTTDEFAELVTLPETKPLASSATPSSANAPANRPFDLVATPLFETSITEQTANNRNASNVHASRYCPNCGARREADATFCVFCGEAI